MEKKLDAEKAIENLVNLWAHQSGVKVTKRGSNEKNNINTNAGTSV